MNTDQTLTDIPQWQPWFTADQIAQIMRDELQSGSRPTQVIRFMMDGINRLPDAHKTGKLAEALVEPSSTGDERWDTLLAAAIRYRLRTMGVLAPVWTLKPPLPKLWWPAPISKRYAAFDLATTPAELRRVGIFINENSFTTC